METDNNIRLTAAELSELWGSYQNDTLSICVFRYFLSHVEDTQTRQLVQHALELSQSHISRLVQLFENEGNAVPQGFTDEDVNETAPRLFSDSFMLMHIQQMGMIGMNTYSVAVSLSTRQDVRAYYSQCLQESDELHKMANKILLSKGLYIRPPYIPTQDKVTFVESNDFLQGWFGKRRPILSFEIANLFANIQRNALGIALLIGFSQVSKSKEITNFFIRGKEIASKHVEIFGSILREDDLPIPMTWDAEVTKSTVPPFSDKLMMFMTASIIGIGIGYYGTSLASSLRTDISTHYVRLTAEIGKYSLDGAKLLIKHGWMEQPPMQVDRDKLAKKQQ
ncbi:DUF3231 family protein [Lentibacillus sp. N15]|uniref:DUF3231 family protein n=1 Tax=Lentibacillus songyuanensis TaxID=3136161 RepID=UPI0031B9E8FF